MQLALSRTKSFRQFQSRIGSANYRLNTILVGLEHVAAGGDKIGYLPITWNKPASPELARQVSDQAKIFACSGALTFASDVLDNFIKNISSEAWLGFDQSTIAIATKAITRPSSEGGAYSVAERAQSLCVELKLEDYEVELALLDLFSKWRNITVHSEERETSLKDEFLKTLSDKKNQAAIKSQYSNFDISLAIHNFDRKKHPVPKEVSSLIAAAQNLCRKIDKAAIVRVASTTSAVEKIADAMISNRLNSTSKNIKSLKMAVAAVWQGGLEKTESHLVKLLNELGFAVSKDPVSAPLSATYLSELAKLSGDEAAGRFGISAD